MSTSAAHGLRSLGDTAAQRHRIGAGGDHLQSFAEDPLGQHGGGGRAVARHVVRLAGRLFQQLGTQVLVRIVQFDLFRDRHAVFRDLG